MYNWTPLCPPTRRAWYFFKRWAPCGNFEATSAALRCPNIPHTSLPNEMSRPDTTNSYNTFTYGNGPHFGAKMLELFFWALDCPPRQQQPQVMVCIHHGTAKISWSGPSRKAWMRICVKFWSTGRKHWSCPKEDLLPLFSPRAGGYCGECTPPWVLRNVCVCKGTSDVRFLLWHELAVATWIGCPLDNATSAGISITVCQHHSCGNETHVRCLVTVQNNVNKTNKYCAHQASPTPLFL